MSIANLWERYVFKKRNLMSYALNKSSGSMVRAIEMLNFKSDLIQYPVDERLAEFFRMRKNNSAWIYFEYCDGEKLSGYSFLHAPNAEEWNDSLPTYPGEARISSTFVYPEYRGKGVRGKLFAAQASYAAARGLKLWAVIEQSNAASMRAAQKTGKVFRRNYLIKFIARNVVTILTNPIQFYFLMGSRRARR